MTEINENIIISLLKISTVARDALPYTPEFDQLHDLLRTKYNISASKNQLWLAILRTCKKGGCDGKSKGQVVVKILNPQQTVLWGIVQNFSNCDKLPYTREFDEFRTSFNTQTGLKLNQHEFWRLISKVRKGRITKEVEAHLNKAKESACLAVEIYNKPLVSFRSGGFVILMNVSWTSLFHAIFFKRGVKPFYKNESGHYAKIDGDYKAWELNCCLNEYYGSHNPPIRKNLEFFIGLRNKREKGVSP